MGLHFLGRGDDTREHLEEVKIGFDMGVRVGGENGQVRIKSFIFLK